MSDKKRKPWSDQEDEFLRKRIKTYGLNNWSVVADGLPGRSGKSCSERWRIYLTPGVKRPTLEPFNEYETAVVYLGQLVHGNNWSSIAKLLPGRTNTAIKNFWKSALRTAEHLRVSKNTYIQQGHTLESLLDTPPPKSQVTTASSKRRRKAAAVPARHVCKIAHVWPAGLELGVSIAEPTVVAGNAGSDAAAIDTGGVACGVAAALAAACVSDDNEMASDSLNVRCSEPTAASSEALVGFVADSSGSSSDEWTEQQQQQQQEGMAQAEQAASPARAHAGKPAAAAAAVAEPDTAASAMSADGAGQHVVPSDAADAGTNATNATFAGYYTAAAAAGSEPAAETGSAALQPLMTAGLTQQHQYQLGMYQPDFAVCSWPTTRPYSTAAATVQRQMSRQASSNVQQSEAKRKRRYQKGAAHDTDCEQDAEELRAATEAAAAAVASGEIQLNPNVHPAAAVAAAADAARAVARAAARKAWDSATAQPRKKVKPGAAETDAASAAVQATATTADSGSTSNSNDAALYNVGLQTCTGGSGRHLLDVQHLQSSAKGSPTPRYKRKSVQGLAKVMAAVTASEAGQGSQQMQQQLAGSQQYQQGSSATAVNSSALTGTAGDSWRLHSNDGPSASDYLGLPMGSVPDNTFGPADPAIEFTDATSFMGYDHQYDDPIMMELLRHDMFITQALGSGPAVLPEADSSMEAMVVAPGTANIAPAAAAWSFNALAGNGLTAPAPAGSDRTAMLLPHSRSSDGSAQTAVVASPVAAVSSDSGVSTATIVTSNLQQAPAGLPSPTSGLTVRPANALPMAASAAAAAILVAVAAVPIKSNCDSEDSVITVSSHTSCTNGNSQAAPASPSAAAAEALATAAVAGGGSSGSVSGSSPVSNSSGLRPLIKGGLKGTGLPAPAFSGGCYVTITSANGQQQQVLVQPEITGISSNSRLSSTGGSSSSLAVSADALGALPHMPVSSQGCSSSWQISATPGPASGHYTATNVADSIADIHGSCNAYSGSLAAEQQHPMVHNCPAAQHNPVLAALMAHASMMQGPASCPVMQATIAAMSSQTGCTCVYCMTGASRKHWQASYMGLQAAAAAGPGSAELAALAMPPPKPVMVQGNSAAAVSAVYAAANTMPVQAAGSVSRQATPGYGAWTYCCHPPVTAVGAAAAAAPVATAAVEGQIEHLQHSSFINTGTTPAGCVNSTVPGQHDNHRYWQFEMTLREMDATGLNLGELDHHCD